MKTAFVIALQTLATIAAFVLLTTRNAEAHMPWLASDESGHAILWFGESPVDRTYHLPAPIATIELIPYSAQGPESAMTTKTIDADDFVGIRSQSTVNTETEVAGVVTYGLYHGMKLTYHVEHLSDRDPDDWPTEPRPNVPLQTIIIPSADGGVNVTVLQNGKPVKDAEVSLQSGEDSDSEKASAKTDAIGMVTFAADKVKKGLNAVSVGLNDEAAKGEYEGESYVGEANYLTATFFNGEAAAKSPEAKAKAAKPTVIPNSPVSVVPTDLPELPESLTSFGAAAAGGKVYLYGGHTGSAHSYSTAEQSDRLWCLDTQNPESGWQKISTGPRLQGLGLVAWKEKLIRIGGFTAMNKEGDDHDLHSQNQVAAFDVATKTWSDLPALPEPRSSLDAAILGDFVYVVGGWKLSGESSDNQWHSTAWRLNLAAENATWEAIANPPFQRRANSIAAHKGKLFVIGGMQEKGGPTVKTGVYDPATDKWSDGPELPGRGMAGFGAASFECNGQLYVSSLGGFVHQLSEDGSQWLTVAEMKPARFFHRMLPTGTSRMLLLGGANMEIGKFTNIDAVKIVSKP